MKCHTFEQSHLVAIFSKGYKSKTDGLISKEIGKSTIGTHITKWAKLEENLRPWCSSCVFTWDLYYICTIMSTPLHFCLYRYAHTITVKTKTDNGKDIKQCIAMCTMYMGSEYILFSFKLLFYKVKNTNWTVSAKSIRIYFSNGKDKL